MEDETTPQQTMNLLSDNKYIFIGQTVEFSGSPFYESFKHVPFRQRIETGVCEDLQMGISIGMALEGQKVCSIYPRQDFLIHALPQIVNHLDKIKEMSHGQYNPAIIIRTKTGETKPLYPGVQHCSDYYEGLEKLLKNIKVVKLTDENIMISTYQTAMKNVDKGISTIIIEEMKK